MLSIARQFALAEILLSLLGMGWHLEAASGQDHSAEPVREQPKVSTDAERVMPEQLASPREVESEIMVIPDPYFFRPPTRINRYDVWQLYEVGRFGQFRPRVIYSPYGAFYLYDGQPFPWVSTHQRDFIPRLIGP